MAKVKKEFTNEEFEKKIIEVRMLESLKHHQNDMYSKPLQIKRKDAVCNILKSIVKDKEFLDVGCAEGLFCNYALEYGAKSATGIEIASKKVDIAKNQYPKCNFYIADVLNIDLKKKFDIILCSEVLQHLVDYKRCINEMVNILDESGTLMITIPNLATGSEHEFADIDHTANPSELLYEIGGASFGKQNAIWKFNAKQLSEEIHENHSLLLSEFIKIGAKPFPHQTIDQAKNIFTVMTFVKHFNK